MTAQPPGGDVRRGPGERDAGEQEHVDRQPGLAQQQRRQQRQGTGRGRRRRGRADHAVVPGPGVGGPQVASSRRHGQQAATGQHPTAHDQDRPLGDQSHQSEREDQQRPRSQQQPAQGPGPAAAEVDELVGTLGPGVAQDGDGGRPTRQSVPQGPDPGPQPVAAVGEQRTQVALRHGPGGSPRSPGPVQADGVAQHPRERPDLVARSCYLAGQQQGQCVQGGPEQQPRDEPQQPHQRGVGEQDPQRVAAVCRRGPTGGCVRLPVARRRGPGVPDRGRRDDEDPVAGGVDAPAQVEVVAEDRQGGVQPSEGVPHVPAHEGAGSADGQDVPDGVVLALVVLPPLQAGLPVTGRVGRDAHLDQDPWVRPVAGFGAQKHGRRGLLRLLEQRLERAGLDGAVVVQQPDPGAARALRQAGGDGRREAGVARELYDGAVGPLEQRGAAVRRAGVDADDRGGHAGAGLQGGQGLGQPALPVVGDEHRGHVCGLRPRSRARSPQLGPGRRGGGTRGQGGIDRGGGYDGPAGRAVRRRRSGPQ